MKNEELTIDLEKNGDQVIVVGKLTLTKDSELFNAPSLYHKVVMVLQYNTGYQVLRPFADKIIFEDDVLRTSSMISGNFKFDITDIIKKLARNKYYILFSMGGYLSNVINLNLVND